MDVVDSVDAKNGKDEGGGDGNDDEEEDDVILRNLLRDWSSRGWSDQRTRLCRDHRFYKPIISFFPSSPTTVNPP